MSQEISFAEMEQEPKISSHATEAESIVRELKLILGELGRRPTEEETKTKMDEAWAEATGSAQQKGKQVEKAMKRFFAESAMPRALFNRIGDAIDKVKSLKKEILGPVFAKKRAEARDEIVRMLQNADASNADAFYEVIQEADTKLQTIEAVEDDGVGHPLEDIQENLDNAQDETSEAKRHVEAALRVAWKWVDGLKSWG